MLRAGIIKAGEEKSLGEILSMCKNSQNNRMRGEGGVKKAEPDTNAREPMQRKSHLNTKKPFFTVRIVKHWDRLSREPVKSPSFEIFKT